MRAHSHSVRTPARTYALAAAAFLFGALAAHAAAAKPLRLCNETSHVLMVALAIDGNDKSRSYGWLRLWPGSCDRPDVPWGKGDAVFVHASSHRAHAGTVLLFEGRERFCIQPPPVEFTIQGRRDCNARALMSADFAAVQLDSSRPVVNFVATENYSQRRARIAGAQRLLGDIGRSRGRIDGFASKQTMAGLNQFRKAAGLAVRRLVYEEDLQALLTAADNLRAGRGLDLCNDTPRMIWAALGQVRADDFESQGWLKVQSGACVKAINEALEGRYYFVYGESRRSESLEAADGFERTRRYWGGDFGLCVKPTRFVIKGRENCAARGFREIKFLRLDTGRAVKWEYRFTP